jgi:hypothetical protein
MHAAHQNRVDGIERRAQRLELGNVCATSHEQDVDDSVFALEIGENSSGIVFVRLGIAGYPPAVADPKKLGAPAPRR